MSKDNPEWIFELWRSLLGEDDEENLSKIKKRVEEYRDKQFTMENEVIDIICNKFPFEPDNTNTLNWFFIEESAKLKSPKIYQRDVCIKFIQELQNAGFDIVKKQAKTYQKGWLNKTIDGKWLVKWSDLHSFGHGTHWNYTELHPDSATDMTYVEEKTLQDKEVFFELITEGYDEKEYTPYNYAKIVSI